MGLESKEHENLYVVMSASGFDNPKRVKSALMFAALAASAGMETVLYCVQSAVDVMIKGAIEKNESPEPESPTMLQRLQEAMAMGVRIMCCTQTMKNRGIEPAHLIDGVEAAGAMTLIHLTTKAKGSISF